jgi:hypothetical protein
MVAFKQESNRRFILYRSVSAAQKSADLVRTLYITGLTDFQRLLDMERDLSEQQDRLAASRGTVSQNLILLYKALGGGWDNQPDQAVPSSGNTLVEEQQEQQQDVQTTSQDHFSSNLTRYYDAIDGGNNQPNQTDTSDNTHVEEQQ